MGGRRAGCGAGRDRGWRGPRDRASPLAAQAKARLEPTKACEKLEEGSPMRLVGIAAVLLLCSAAALAQVPPEIAAQTRVAGQSMDPATGQPYAALFPPSAWDGVDVARDIAYGPDPLHKIDIYTTPHADARRPVLLFGHGGGF